MLLMVGDGVDTVHRNVEDLLMRWCRRWSVMTYSRMNDGDAESRVPGMLTTGREINEVHSGPARENVTVEAGSAAASLPLKEHCISTLVACSNAVIRWKSSNANQEI